MVERAPDRIAQVLNDSAETERDAAKSRVETGQDMNLEFGRPIFLLFSALTLLSQSGSVRFRTDMKSVAGRRERSR